MFCPNDVLYMAYLSAGFESFVYLDHDAQLNLLQIIQESEALAWAH
jgi:hypothetical protein